MTNLAQKFVDDRQQYFFRDAHFLVEAEAKTLAREVKYNVFMFEDGSLLQIDNVSASFRVYAPDSAAALSARAVGA